MKTVFVDVDVQHDFCDPSGALFVAGADALAGAFRALTARAVERGRMIVGSVDSHAFDAWEFAGAPVAGPSGERPGFPPHCVKGTAGWLKAPGTMTARARFVPNAPLSPEALAAAARENAPTQLLLEKEVYSLFANPNAEALLELLTEGEAARFVVYGVATDYCVKAACEGLLRWATSRGRGEVWLVTDAVAAVVAADGDRAIQACEAAGVRLVRVADALEAA
ncbi:MAG: isochorismatase family protein [Polyangiaceae bacterium]|nr:isochorismatase family protein [Polyangiaceae bacterium]